MTAIYSIEMTVDLDISSLTTPMIIDCLLAIMSNSMFQSSTVFTGDIDPQPMFLHRHSKDRPMLRVGGKYIFLAKQTAFCQ